MEDYDWGLAPEKAAGFRLDMAVSVAFEISRSDVARIIAPTSREISE